MNASWHHEIESACTVEETVASVRRYLGSLSLHDLDRLPRYCDPKRIKCDDDVDDLTFKLSQLQRESGEPAPRAIEDAFGYMLHASLRISRLNRQRVQSVPFTPHTSSGFTTRQMH
jgi:hypothetical protein